MQQAAAAAEPKSEKASHSGAAVAKLRVKLALRDGRGITLENDHHDALMGHLGFHIQMGSAKNAIEVEWTADDAIKVVGGHHTLGCKSRAK